MRENRDIKAITVNGTEIKLSQYANDKTLTLDGSNLRLNNSKNGRSTLDKSKLWKCWSVFSERNFKWIKDKGESSVGVILSTSWENSNFKRNVLSCWEYRRLNLLGKIAILKSLVASQLVYVLSSLQTSRTIIMKEVNKLFFSFFWNSNGDKIKRHIIINDYLHGGYCTHWYSCVGRGTCKVGKTTA